MTLSRRISLLLVVMLTTTAGAQGPGGTRGPGPTSGADAKGPKTQGPAPRTAKRKPAETIWDAARLGQLDDVRRLLAAQPDLAEATDSDQRTALHLAARHGHFEVVELLLERGAPPDSKAYNRFTPLHLAVTFNRPAIVDLLLDQDVDPNAVTAFDRTPIDLAAQRSRWQLVDRLIRGGAVFSAFAAATRGDAKRIEELLADPAATVSRDAMLQAIRGGHAEIAVMMLPRIRPTPPMPNQSQIPLLFEATHSAEVTKALIAAGEDPAQRLGTLPMRREPPGGTLLHVAAKRGHVATMQVLLELDVFADPDARDDPQMTPAHWAARSGHLSALQMLLERGADLRAKDRNGRTAVHHAAVAGEAEILRWFVKQGVVLHDTDNGGRTALQLATKRIHPTDESTPARIEAAWLLVRHGVEVDLLSAAVIGDPASAKALLEENPQLADTKGAVTRAMSFGHRDIVALLLDAGHDATTRDERKSSYLHWAGLWRQPECAQLLIDRGCDVHATNKFGYTPLHEAARANCIGVAKVLLAAGAERGARDSEGKTPRELLTSHSPPDLRELLQPTK